MKKTLFLSCLLLLFIFSCGSEKKQEESKDGSVTLRFATWDTGQELEIQKEIAKKFTEKNPKIKIQVEAYGDGFDQKLVASFGAKDAPDVMYMWDFPTYGSSLEDLNPYIAKDSSIDIKDFYEGLLHYVQMDGKTYGIPSGFTTHVMYYNKKLFDAAGVAYPTENWTWEEFAEKAQKLSKPDEKIYGFGVPSKPDPYDFEQFLWSFGSSYISPDGKTLKGYLDSPESIAAAQLFGDLVKSKAGVLVGKKDQQSGDDIFKAQKIAMWESGIWPLNGFKEAGVDFGIALMPRKGTNPPKSVVSLSAVAMWKDSKHKDAAWEFIKFYNSEEAAKLRVTDLPVRKSLVEKFGTTKDPMMKPFYTMLETSDNTPAFLLNKNWKEVQRNLGIAIENIMIGNQDAKTAFTDVVTKSEFLLN
ncbi:MAG: sugar ABC transporter substrate-binding protein [Sebaldella sp.]|mgnify:CR=1 FL=1|nr:sugar ABC transporter substrate-binding protein [Sebaldella sp.]